MKIKPKSNRRLVKLTKTCEACPAQWEGQTEDGQYVYARYRWGILSVGFGKTLDHAIANREISWDYRSSLSGSMSKKEFFRLTGFKHIKKEEA